MKRRHGTVMSSNYSWRISKSGSVRAIYACDLVAVQIK